MYTVLLTDADRVDIRPVSRLLAKLFRVPLIDVTTHLRNVRGFVYERLEEHTAREITQILVDSGQPAACLPSDDVPTLPAPKRVTWADPAGEAFTMGVVYAQDERVQVPWDKFHTLSVGIIRMYEPEMKLVDSSEFQQMMKLNQPEDRELMRKAVTDQVLSFGQSDHALPPQLGESLLESNTKLPLEYHLDIILKDPWFVVRISQHEFSYEALDGAGTSALANFHLLVKSLLAQAPHTHQLPTAARFVSEQVREVDLFESVRQYELYNRWQFALMQLPGATPGATEDTDTEDGAAQ